MELTDICSLSRWEKLENDIFEKFNFQGSVFNPSGIRITEVKNWSNTLCPAIKATEKGQSYICSMAHMNMTAIAKKTKVQVVEECDAGFSKIVIPIYLGDEFLGVAGGCGLVAQDGEVDTFAVTKITEMDEAKVEDLAKDMPTISKEEMTAAGDFIESQLTLILSESDKGRPSN
ncbi:MAG: PocR ligand-binding domain-containing protein [Desulfobacter sp.]|nr:PocR ligand-binding domain-containing protein [Desulfobacter sp.]WDP87385.1 MAG: PocR ligand-binding domain-containing protein [Desulfobacter sp.]